jgi:sensor histidine kinase YesM
VQPLVENAIKHGLTPKPLGGKIRITVNVSTERAHVQVQDDGVGWESSQAALTRGTGHGLSALKRRLSLHFGNNFELQFIRDHGVTVNLFFPVEANQRKGDLADATTGDTDC